MRTMKRMMITSMITMLVLSVPVISATEQTDLPVDPLAGEIDQILLAVATSEIEQEELATQINDAQNNGDQDTEEQLQAQLEQKEKIQTQMTASIIMSAQQDIETPSELAIDGEITDDAELPVPSEAGLVAESIAEPEAEHLVQPTAELVAEPAQEIQPQAAQLSVSATTQIGMIDIQGMDIETALMMVQQQRTKLLDNQLNDQIAALQRRNDEVAKLNDALSGLNKVQGSLPSDIGVSTLVELTDEAIQAMKNVGIEVSDTNMTKGELEKYQTQLKSNIDSQSNSQQMDMLRLQSMSNKRNEAFDVMTNFIKKMQESRSSIIGNMR